MRTTLNIEDDVFIITQNMARRQGKSMGAILSELARQTLQTPEANTMQSYPSTNLDAQLQELGVTPYYAPNAQPLTNDLVNKLREEAGV